MPRHATQCSSRPFGPCFPEVGRAEQETDDEAKCCVKARQLQRVVTCRGVAVVATCVISIAHVVMLLNETAKWKVAG